MKIKSIFPLLAIAAISCSKTDDSVPTALDGTWIPVKKVIISGKNNAVLLTENASACKAKETYVFTDKAKFTFSYYSDTNGTCNMDGTETGSYSYNSNSQILSLNYSGGGGTSFTVTKITDSELQIWENNVDYNGDGFKDKQIYYYKK